MYDRHLESFIQAADSGSFSKAAESMYISANAITKQINLLEERLGLPLFHRSNQGLTLTKAGELIYQEAKKIIRHSDEVLRTARELENMKETVIRIGVSLMNPSRLLMEQWSRASALHPGIKLEIVPYEDSVPVFNDILEHFGKNIDVIACPYQSAFWGDRYRSFHLLDLPACISCSSHHRLASRNKLEIPDLYGETLILSRHKTSGTSDSVYEFLQKSHPQIQLREVGYYDFNLFNQVVSSNDLILSAECWADVHPLLVTIPVSWEFSFPYGLIYPNNPPDEILQFIMAIGSVQDSCTK